MNFPVKQKKVSTFQSRLIISSAISFRLPSDSISAAASFRLTLAFCFRQRRFLGRPFHGCYRFLFAFTVSPFSPACCHASLPIPAMSYQSDLLNALNLVQNSSAVKYPFLGNKKTLKPHSFKVFSIFGGDEEDRTLYLLNAIASRLLKYASALPPH